MERIKKKRSGVDVEGNSGKLKKPDYWAVVMMVVNYFLYLVNFVILETCVSHNPERNRPICLNRNFSLQSGDPVVHGPVRLDRIRGRSLHWNPLGGRRTDNSGMLLGRGTTQ